MEVGICWQCGRRTIASASSQVFGWIQTYREQMASLGIEDEDLEFRKCQLIDLNPALLPKLLLPPDLLGPPEDKRKAGASAKGKKASGWGVGALERSPRLT